MQAHANTLGFSSSGVRLFLIALFLLVLAGGVFIQAEHLDYPIAGRGGDGHRDYLIASHIASYGEVPLLGPISGGSEGMIPNSPVYWYLLAPFAAFSQDIMLLELVGMLFWAAGAAFLFFFAYLAFGPVAAFAGGLLHILVSVSWAATGTGVWSFGYIWQPIFMVPLVFFSLFLLALGYRRKSLPLLFFSIVAWTLAGAVHNGAFLLFPFLLLSVGLVLWQWRAKRVSYGTMLGGVLASMLLWYMPVLVHAFSQDLSVLDVRDTSFFSLESFSDSFRMLVTRMVEDLQRVVPGLASWSPSVLLAGAVFYFSPFVRRSRETKGITGLLLAASFFYITLVSFLFPNPHNLLPLYGLFAVAGSEIVRTIFSQHFLLKLAALPLLAFALAAFTHSPLFEKISMGRLQTVSNQELMAAATSALTTEIRDIQQREGYEEPNFFHLTSYSFVGEGEDSRGQIIPMVTPTSNDILWVLLEQRLGAKLTEAEVVGKSSFVRTANRNSVTFIACYAFQPSDSFAWCAEAFRTQTNNETVLESVYESPILSILKTEGGKHVPP